MDDGMHDILYNIRACIVTNRVPLQIRNLNRDYDSIVGNPIPFRQFNFATLEEFLRSFPTLRVHGSGQYATVEALPQDSSSHVTALIAKQKAPKKPASSKFYPNTSPHRGRGVYRGRGRGRGRGGNSLRPYAPPRDYTAREQSGRYPNGYHGGDQASGGGDYDYNDSVPERYSPNSYNRQDSAQPGGPLTVKVDRDDKRQVLWNPRNRGILVTINNFQI